MNPSQCLSSSPVRLPPLHTPYTKPTEAMGSGPRPPLDDANALPARETLLAAMIDQFDSAVLVVDHAARVLMQNRQARRLLADKGPLQEQAGQLRASDPTRHQRLCDAILTAARTGKRSLLPLGAATQLDGVPLSLAVVPLAAGYTAAEPAVPHSCPSAPVLLIVGRQRICEPLTLAFFVRNHGITPAEAAVLSGLCAGATPSQLARASGNSLTTVRTHIARLRAKTDARSVNGLMRQVVSLPSIVTLY